MKTLYQNGYIFTHNGFEKRDFCVSNDTICTSIVDDTFYDSIIDCTNKYIVPGFVDVHVHLREPGFFYKETIKSGTQAACKGGYTTVFSMPNLKPAPSNMENLKQQLDIIEKDAVIEVIPYGTITSNQSGVGTLSNMEEISQYICGFSDDGKGIQTSNLMKEAMLKAKALNKPIVAHCEDENELHGGYIHEGEYCKKHNHVGINSKSEWAQVKRDIELVKETGCQYHVCHVSTKESVALIREAKKAGLKITAETGPHYLILTDNDLQEDGRFKMNPPLRSEEDKKALIEGIKDHTLEVIATDHAPHSNQEKSQGLKNSLFGIVGLETCFQLLYTYLVKNNVITLEELINLMAINPRKIFNLQEVYIEDNNTADFCIIDLNTEETIDSNKFVSMGKATPFDGYKVKSKIIQTVYHGKTVYKDID